MTFSVPPPSLRSHFVSTRGQRLLAPFLPLIYPFREMKRVSFDSLYFACYNTTLFKLPSFVTPLWELELQLPIYRVPPDSTPRIVDVKAQRLAGAVDTSSNCGNVRLAFYLSQLVRVIYICPTMSMSLDTNLTTCCGLVISNTRVEYWEVIRTSPPLQ
jgi:hypothetical protein